MEQNLFDFIWTDLYFLTGHGKIIYKVSAKFCLTDYWKSSCFYLTDLTDLTDEPFQLMDPTFQLIAGFMVLKSDENQCFRQFFVRSIEIGISSIKTHDPSIW